MLKKKSSASSLTHPMDALLKKTTLNPPKKGQEINAKIISLARREVLFDIGWKSYAILGDEETKQLSTYMPYLKVGDTMKVKIVVEESKEGYPVVSMRKFFEKGKWDILKEKQKKEELVDVVCGEYGKGGVFVDFMGIRGVIPKIQLNEEYIDKPDKLYGQKVKVKILEVDREKNRLVVSQKAVTQKISYKKIKEEFEKIELNKPYKAKVIGFSEFGVFCEIGSIEGLIHISEISWEKVSDPSKYLSVGQYVDVVATEKNESNFKLNLSIKRLIHDPWEDIENKYPKDKEISGEIIRKERYGYIVRLEPGIEGLIHVSKIPQGTEYEIGKKVHVYIEKIDSRNRRMSLIVVSKEKPVVYR